MPGVLDEDQNNGKPCILINAQFLKMAALLRRALRVSSASSHLFTRVARPVTVPRIIAGKKE